MLYSFSLNKLWTFIVTLSFFSDHIQIWCTGSSHGFLFTAQCRFLLCNEKKGIQEKIFFFFLQFFKVLAQAQAVFFFLSQAVL